MKHIALIVVALVSTVWLKPDTTSVGRTASSVASGFSRTVITRPRRETGRRRNQRGDVRDRSTPESAPNQVAHFTKLVAEGGYDGTVSSRRIRWCRRRSVEPGSTSAPSTERRPECGKAKPARRR
jgi:hypothetical protein